eukprot:TRINITY_DN46830_c0_g1_i1.p1 TRINITY_DN46830_c0_g1~~TRINITY_DN46830_c0_g1_i1.p1  ORF type:complete len:520 (+),score=136.24 TRINITY_DN46830_c0_g1_i1:80-1561(+)
MSGRRGGMGGQQRVVQPGMFLPNWQVPLLPGVMHHHHLGLYQQQRAVVPPPSLRPPPLELHDRHVVQSPPAPAAIAAAYGVTAPPVRPQPVRPPAVAPPIKVPPVAVTPIAAAAAAGAPAAPGSAVAAAAPAQGAPAVPIQVEVPAELEPSLVLPTAHCMCFHPSYPQEPYLITGDSEGVLTVCRTAEPMHTYQLLLGASDAPVLSCVSADGQVFVTVGGEVVALEWAGVLTAVQAAEKQGGSEPAAAGHPIRLGAPEHVRTVHSVPRGELAVSLAVIGNALYVGDSCGQICSFSLPALELQQSPSRLHHGNVTALAADGEGRVITASDDGTVCFTETGKAGSTVSHYVPCVLAAPEDAPRSRKRSADGQQKDTGDGNLLVFAVNAIDVDSDGFWLAIGGDVPYVPLFNLLTQRVQKILPLPHPDLRVRSVKFLRSVLLVGVDDGTVLVYGLSGQLLDTKQAACETAHAIAVAGNGHWAATGRNTSVEVYGEL